MQREMCKELGRIAELTRILELNKNCQNIRIIVVYARNEDQQTKDEFHS